MNDNTLVLEAIAKLSTKVDGVDAKVCIVDANVDAVRHETANLAIASVRQTNEIADLTSRVKLLEVGAVPIPRAPASTLAEIEEGGPRVSDSIMVIRKNSRRLLNENRVFGILVLVVVPITVAWITSHH